MPQFLRPDSNVTRSNITGSYTAIWEETADDSDYVYGAVNTAAVFETGLGNPAATPASGTATVRYRIAKIATNEIAGLPTLSGDGNSADITCEVYEGPTPIDADTARTATGTWTEYSFNPDLSGVTDWTDLRLRFTTTASGGTPQNQRGGAISWAELEAPDEETGVDGVLNATLDPFTMSATGHVLVSGALNATLADFTLTARGGGPITYGSLNQTLEPFTLFATAHAHSLFDKAEKPPLVDVDRADLDVGIFDPAIFDPAIFDTGSSPAFTKSPKPPTVET